MEETIKYPVRINKFLALKNICSRRKADEFIAEKRIKINNRTAVLGDKVNAEDMVEVVREEEMYQDLAYFAFNKPAGIVTHSPQNDEKEISDIIKFPIKVFPIGRLDKDSEGLIIMTNDGRITDKLLNPERYHEKEYLVSVDKIITPQFLKQMGLGVALDNNYQTRPCQIKKINRYSFSIILTEGKKRQIRRMCMMLGYDVMSLVRTRILNIRLNDLDSGRYRKIRGIELKEFLLGLDIAEK